MGTSRRLLVLGRDGALRIVDGADPAGEDRLVAPADRARTITAPVWGPDGSWVAWTDHDTVEGTVRVHSVDGEVLCEAPGFIAFCLDPSPCGRRLATLSSGPLGLELSVIDIDGGSTRLVGRGAPLYWAWSPDGDRLAVHLQRRVAVHRLVDGAEHELVADASPFLAPWWSPDGTEIVIVDDDGRMVVTSPAADAPRHEIAPRQSGFRFAVDPSGRRVAYVGQADHPPGASVTYVADRLLADSEVAFSEPVAGLWWSPEGRRLAALVRAGDGDRLVCWRIWDGETVLASAPFAPTPEVAGSILPFFEQFAPAHRFWSADGEALTMTAVQARGRPRVLVVDLDDPDEPAEIADGVLAWFSPT